MFTRRTHAGTVPKDFLPLELKVDLYKAPLCMTAMAVQNIRVKDILYLRDVLSFCKEQLTPYNYLHETTLDLLSKPEVQAAMKDGVNGEFLNRSVNLRIDHCLWHETSRGGREGSAAFGECMACNVPLVRSVRARSARTSITVFTHELKKILTQNTNTRIPTLKHQHRYASSYP